jgi:GAF domain-containing protein
MESMPIKQRKGESLARLAFLRELRPILGGSDPMRMLQLAARCITRTIAEYCIIDVAGSGSASARIEIAHADASRWELLRSACERFSPPANGRVARLLSKGEPMAVERVTSSTMLDRGDLDFWEGKRPRSFLGVPIIVRGQPFAAMTWVSITSAVRFDEGRLEFAKDVAGWCALGIEASFARASAPRLSYAPPQGIQSMQPPPASTPVVIKPIE